MLSRAGGRISDGVSGSWTWFRGLDRNRQLIYGGGALVLVILAGVGIAAVTGGGSTPTTLAATTLPPTTTTTATTTTTSTTTTSIPGVGSPLNGLEAENPSNLERGVIGIKIDNHPNARPQSGLNDADMVYELLVEGGLSRFIALYHDNDISYIGPIRSARPTDPTLLKPFDAVFVNSGSQDWVSAIVNDLDVQRLVEPRPGTFRIGSRFAPHNLYGDTEELRQVATDQDFRDDPPGQFFVFGEFVGTDPAATISMDWDPANRVLWAWDGTKYLRFTNDLPHEELGPPPEGDEVEPTRHHVNADVIIVLFGELYTARPSGAGTPVPAMETTGQGAALVFAEGKVIAGTWERTEPEDPFELLDESGAPLAVPPGKPWVAFFPDSQEVTWSAVAAELDG